MEGDSGYRGKRGLGGIEGLELGRLAMDFRA